MKQIIIFLLVGGISTILNFLIFLILLDSFSFSYMVASPIGYFSGVVIGYFLNTKYTFNENKFNSPKKIILYIMVYIISLFLSLGLLYVLVEIINISEKVANICAIFQSTITNYLGCKYVVFRK